MDFKRYSFLFLVGLTSLLVATASLNYLVDPYWFFDAHIIPGFNEIKPDFGRHERQVKPSILKAAKPEVVIFGSSYAEIGIDPLSPAFQRIGKAFNFAMGGAFWDTVYCNLQFAITRDENLKVIVLGIHAQPMPRENCSAKLQSMDNPGTMAFLLAAGTLRSSIKTVLSQDTALTHTRQGKFFFFRGRSGTADRFRKDLGNNQCGYRPGSPYRSTGNVTPLDLEGLRDIVRETAARRISVKLFIYPHHAMLIEQQDQCGAYRTRWQELAELLSMVEKESAGFVEVWDFDGFHEIGTETITNAPGYWWQDPMHFNSEFGDIIVDEMFNRKVSAVGMRITSANLAGYEIRREKEHEAYLANHPEFVPRLDSLMSKTAR